MKKYLLNSISAILFIVFSQSSFAQIQNYVIFGQVTEAQTGIGIPNQVITIESSDSINIMAYTLMTNELGNYEVIIEFAPPVFNNYLIVSYLDECGNYFSEFIEVLEQGTSQIDFVSCGSTNPVDSCMAYFWYESYNNTVNFYDASFTYSPVSEWFWDFGDGTASTEQNPMHTYGQEGQYIVTLSILSEDCQSSYTEFIYDGNDTTWNGCYASFWYYADWNEPFTVFFQNYSSVNEESFVTWDFGDNTISNEFMPVHTYSGPGVYPVTLTVDDSICGVMTYTDFVYVEENINPGDCYADFYYSTDSLGYTFNFYNNSLITNQLFFASWDFGDGEFSTDFEPTHTYIADGEYFVTLTMSYENCTATTQQIIYVGENNWYPEYCQAFFFPEYNYENIYDVIFYDYSYGNGEILSYVWDFGDGYGSSLQNPHHIYDQAGEYFVTLTIYSETCSSTFTEFVYIEDWTWTGGCQALFFPNFDETLNVQFFDLSFPLPTSWTWNFGDNTTSYEQNPIHTYSEPGIYTVTLETSNDSACYSAFAMEIELYETLTKSITYAGKINEAYAIHSTTTDIEQIKNNSNKINIYPNPVVNELNISISDKFENAQIQILSITGQIVYSNILINNSITVNTSNFANGLYVARIVTDGKTSNIKFVK